VQQGIEVPPFFPEPQLPDLTWAASGQSTVDWITRSTLPRAREVRHFLNHNLEALPPHQQEPFAHNLRSRWDTALFELVVARLLQGLGGDLEIEVPNSDLRRPDFSLSFGGSRFTIEAVAPKLDRKTAAKQKQDAELIEIVERNAPPEWSIFLTELPDIGQAESKVPFKKALRVLAGESAPHTAGEHRDFVFPLSSGVLSGKLIAGRYGHRAVVGGPLYTEWSDSKVRISRALSRKKAQTRSEAVPVFLAVLASGVSSGPRFQRDPRQLRAKPKVRGSPAAGYLWWHPSFHWSEPVRRQGANSVRAPGGGSLAESVWGVRAADGRAGRDCRHAALRAEPN
jgi:hypothetical protein